MSPSMNYHPLLTALKSSWKNKSMMIIGHDRLPVTHVLQHLIESDKNM